MMIADTSEYAVTKERAREATDEHEKIADTVVGNMRCGLLPKGPVRRAVVFGGSNIHIFDPPHADGKRDLDAAGAAARPAERSTSGEVTRT
jgi:multiple sugar transport system substrate-binding protein